MGIHQTRLLLHSNRIGPRPSGGIAQSFGSTQMATIRLVKNGYRMQPLFSRQPHDSDNSTGEETKISGPRQDDRQKEFVHTDGQLQGRC
jgi:hypothetical protein